MLAGAGAALAAGMMSARATETDADARLILRADRIAALEHRIRQIYDSPIDDAEADRLADPLTTERNLLTDELLAEMPETASPAATTALARAVYGLAEVDCNGLRYTDGGDAEQLALELARLVGGLPA
jgi:hypothetical protein